ncbi:hypothetical protein [Bradyrhizobium sp. AC87j1]|nr:hypothetical protein [Bradyrhizobium sp. AC87j1]
MINVIGVVREKDVRTDRGAEYEHAVEVLASDDVAAISTPAKSKIRRPM